MNDVKSMVELTYAQLINGKRQYDNINNDGKNPYRDELDRRQSEYEKCKKLKDKYKEKQNGI